MKESDYKTKWCKQLRDEGHYARRIEDQFGLGIPDMFWALRGARRPLWVEAKLIRFRSFGPTSRQLVELRRITNSALMDAIVLGYHPDTKVFYYGPPAEQLIIGECEEADTFSTLVQKLIVL